MSNYNLFGSDKVVGIVADAIHGCDDGELYIEDNTSESFIFDDNVLKNSFENKVIFRFLNLKNFMKVYNFSRIVIKLNKL